MPQDFSKFVDKKVRLIRNLKEANAKGETAEEIEGTVIDARGGVVMLKPKGKTTPTLINDDEIEEMDFAADTAKNLARKTLKVVTFGQARNHLLERHGLKLAEVNALTEKDALEKHDKIDHEGDDLGHVHGDKPAPEAAASE